jgi:hypothetical protein
VTEAQREGPWYTGMYAHRDQENGYTLVVPTEWKQIPMKKGLHGMMFSPYENEINTCIMTQKHKMRFKVKTSDLILLRDSFEQGIKDLPGAVIEKFDTSYSDTVNIFDATYTFLDGDVRRKRWTRNIYWGEAQLVVVAQGRTPEDFEFWLPMFYNSITTLSVL